MNATRLAPLVLICIVALAVALGAVVNAQTFEYRVFGDPIDSPKPNGGRIDKPKPNDTQLKVRSQILS